MPAKTMPLPSSQSAFCSPAPRSLSLQLLPSYGNSLQNMKPMETAPLGMTSWEGIAGN